MNYFDIWSDKKVMIEFSLEKKSIMQFFRVSLLHLAVPLCRLKLYYCAEFYQDKIRFVAARGRQSQDFKLNIIDLCRSIPTKSTMLITNIMFILS